MGNEWKEHRLGDIAIFAYGKMPQKHLLGSGDYVTYSGYKYLEPYPEMNAASGDLIVVARGVGGTGDVKLVIRDCYLTNLSIKISLNTSYLLNEYFYYMFKSSNLRYLDSGSAQSQITIADLSNINLKIPNTDYQRLVINQLKPIDEKITLNQQINQTLEQMAQTLFKSWFVDFDPVIDNALDAGFFEQDLAFSEELLRRVESRKAVRQSDNFKPLREDIRQLFPNAFDECAEPALGLGGWVPKGWEVKMLGEITDELRRGISPKYIEEEGVQVINQKCIRNHEISYELTRRHNQEIRSISGRELKLGDVLVNSTGVGTLGRIAQVTSLPETTVVDSHITVVRASDEMCPIFTFGQLMISMEKNIERLGEGSTGQTELSRKILSEQLVILPPRNIAVKAEVSFKSFSEMQTANRNQNMELTKLRDTLLPKLISGELSLSDIKTDIPEETLI